MPAKPSVSETTPRRRAVPIARTVKALRARVAGWRRDGARVALVPTMGALHEGHLSLVRLARRRAERVVVSIFINPTQFAAHEDLDKYPRQERRDLAMLRDLGVDLAFVPGRGQMYPQGFSSAVRVGGPAEAGLEDAFRPHFFGGVATVVAKLLLQCLPDVAVFGEKDYQQLMVIGRMARDLDIPVRILGGATVRESDGLALSSRNAYLTPDERAVAPRLQAALQEAAGALRGGIAPKGALARAKRSLGRAGFTVDYVEARNAETLAPLSGAPGEPTRILAAVWLGKTRLIDNIAV